VIYEALRCNDFWLIISLPDFRYRPGFPSVPNRAPADSARVHARPCRASGTPRRISCVDL